MSDMITGAEKVELVVSGEDAERIKFGEVEDFSIGFDSGVEESDEGVAVAMGETEYEFSFMFEPTPLFLLWWYGVLKEREGELS